MIINERQIVILQGEMDLAVAEEIRSQLDKAVSTGCDVRVDVSRVVYIDSSCIRELLRAHAAAEIRGATLTLSPPRPNVRRTLEVADVASLIGED